MIIIKNIDEYKPIVKERKLYLCGSQPIDIKINVTRETTSQTYAGRRKKYKTTPRKFVRKRSLNKIKTKNVRIKLQKIDLFK